MIYLVEDDASISDLESYALKSAGFEVNAFADSDSFSKALQQGQKPDLVILDWMLPGKSGIEILEALRADPATASLPVLLVTAKNSELDIVKGLDAGADDYLTKPFGILELISRVRALLRRTQRAAQPVGALHFGPISMDDSTHIAAVNGKPVELTFKEYALLELLLAQAGKVVSREEIFSRIWNMDTEVESRTLDMHIRTLRQKLGEAGGYVQTVRKVGYKLEAPQNETGIH